MHLTSRLLRRVLPVALLGAIAPLCLPLVATATFAWGAVQVPGCTWAAAVPTVCANLDVHSNGTNFGTVNGDSGWGLRWQCVELAQRWANLAYGETYHGNPHWGVDSAYQMWGVWAAGNQDQRNYSVPFVQEPNGGAVPPQFGDLMVFAPTSGNPYGHVAVVSGVEQGFVDIVEENWSADSGSARLSIVGTSMPPRGAYQIYGWLRAAYGHNARTLSHTAVRAWTGVTATGKIEASLLGTDSAAWYTTGTGTNYAPPASMSGQLVSAPVQVLDKAGNIELFATDSTHRVSRYVSQPVPAGSTPPSPAPAWTPLSGVNTPGAPAVLKAADGHIEVFVRGMDNAYWRNREVAPGGAWAGWTSLGGILPTDPSAAYGADGMIDLFGIGADNAAWTWHQVSGSNGTWTSLGGIALGAPQVTQTPSGMLDVVLVGGDEALWHQLQTGPAAWTGAWVGMGGRVLGDPTVVRDAAGLPEALAIGTDNGLWIAHRTASGGTAWSNEGGYFQSDVSAQRDGQGLLEVFGVGKGSQLFHAVETHPSGAIGPWGSLGGIWLLN